MPTKAKKLSSNRRLVNFRGNSPGGGGGSGGGGFGSGGAGFGNPTSPFDPVGVDFSTSGAYMRNTAPFSSGFNSQDGIFSGWFTTGTYISTDTPTLLEASISDQRIFTVERFVVLSTLLINFNDNGGNNFTITKLSGFPASSDDWHHILIAWELDATPIVQVYLDDVLQSMSGTPLNITVPWSDTDEFTVGVDNTEELVAEWKGCMSQMFLHNTYLDLSVEANRRKFISAAGVPVDLGSDGSTPLGVQPMVYLNKADPNFHLNSGSGTDWPSNALQAPCASTPVTL